MKAPIAPGARFWETGWNTTVSVPVLWTSLVVRASGRSGPPVGDVVVRDLVFYCCAGVRRLGQVGSASHPPPGRGKGHRCTSSARFIVAQRLPMRRTPTSLPSHPPEPSLPSDLLEACLPCHTYPKTTSCRLGSLSLSRLCLSVCLSVSLDPAPAAPPAPHSCVKPGYAGHAGDMHAGCR